MARMDHSKVSRMRNADVYTSSIEKYKRMEAEFDKAFRKKIAAQRALRKQNAVRQSKNYSDEEDMTDQY